MAAGTKSLWSDFMMYFMRALLYRQAVRSARKKGVVVYLKTLQVVRKSLAGGIFVFLFLQAMVIGFVGSIVCATLLWPEDITTKLWILLGFFGVLFLIPFLFLLFLFSEYVWYQMTGARKMVADLD